MGIGIFLLFGAFSVCAPVKAQHDSLRSALHAVDLRQKDLSDENPNDYGFAAIDDGKDLAFLPPSEYKGNPNSYSHVDGDSSNPLLLPEVDIEKNPTVERTLLDYLEDDVYRDDDIKKRISSSFRERLDEDREKQLEEQTQNYLNNLENERELNEEDDYELIRELWEKYRNYPALYNPRNYDYPKRSYYTYPRPGLDSLNLRKRNKYYEQVEPVYYYNSKDDFFDRLQDEDDDTFYKSHNHLTEKKYSFHHSQSKRFPVSKRSSNIIHEHKRSAYKEMQNKTDPKVIKDLSNLFGSDKTEKITTTLKPDELTTKTVKKSMLNTNKPENKEMMVGLINDKPLQIKKKSINWSDYFGLDRRKKSEDGIDDAWLMDRFHKATNTGRSSTEYPLQSFKNHDQPVKNELNKKDKLTPEEMKVSEMDSKLKNMEDTIIDDALKYTGAHEGATDTKEIQEVKDKIISRLAAAYSLEKMRRALGEYKLTMAKEREKMKQRKPKTDDLDFFEESKRVSVPRKQAIDEDRLKTPEGDNNIKCTQGDENCEEQNYKTPSIILEENSFEDCPRVQKVCGEFSSILGNYARIFEEACNLHQMCLLCNNNSWFAPTRQCNVLFLSKAFELCDGKTDCQKEAQRSVRYLLNVNRSLRMEPLGECELSCPDKR